MIKVTFICDRCGKEQEMNSKEFFNGENVRYRIGYTKSTSKSHPYFMQTKEICEDCLKEFMEWSGMTIKED